MYKKILSNKNLEFKERLKRLLAYSSIKRSARILWDRRFRRLFENHPTYKRPAEKSIEKTHKQYWKPFANRINLATLRVSKNISGISNPKFMPEEIFVSDIEPTLNQTSSVEYLTYKSFYNRWFPGNIFPIDYIHNVDGEWLDNNWNPITIDDVTTIAKKLVYPVVLKPNRDSFGGKGIYFPKDAEELLSMAKKSKNFLVQEKIIQHPFFEQFNKQCLNTLRVYVYRSVSDNLLHIVNIVLRMGLGGSLDNETAGGIITMIRKNGVLNGFAVDKYGKKYFVHPDTGVDFNQKIPDFEALNSVSLKVAHKIFYARLIGLDLCYDREGNWRMIEVNNFSGTIRFAQYHGALFFGEFSDEVYNYCKSNHWALR
jgi:hypothetical protein